MTYPYPLLQTCKIVEAITPQVGAAITGDYVSLKNVHMAWVIVHVAQGNAAQMTISLNRATAVAPTGAVAIANVVKIWANQDCATSDLLVRQTDAINFQLSAAVAHKLVIFQVDPASLGAGYDCIAVATGASNADNLTSAIYVLEERYQGEQPPSAIVD